MNIKTTTAHCTLNNQSCSRYPVFIILVLVLLSSECRKQPAESIKTAAGRSDTISVAFYNVQNLFDYELDGNEYPEYRPDPGNWNQKMFDSKFGNIASAIAALDADVIALCEVEDRDALEHLADILKTKGHPYPFRTIPEALTSGSTRPALLSRLPIKNATEHPVHLPDNIHTRGILEADIDIKGGPLKLFVNHWPSKHHAEKYRLAAADTLRSIIATLPRSTDYVLLGDLNSNYDEFSTFTTFGHNNTRGITGINDYLGTTMRVTAITSRMRNESELITDSFPAHYNLWMELPEPDRMSYVYRGNRQTPDNMLLPPSLYDSAGITYVDNSFNNFTWNNKLLKNGAPFGWEMKYSGKKKLHAGNGYSDHLPILAKFTNSPFSPGTFPVDFAEAITFDNENPDSWFEFHSNGWISCKNGVAAMRDTTAASLSGGCFALHVTAPATNKNYSAMRAVIPAAYRTRTGELYFYLRGSGTICLRTKNRADRWRYHDIVNSTTSGQASYPHFSSAIWQTVTIAPDTPSGDDVELELRSAKNAPLDLWIDR